MIIFIIVSALVIAADQLTKLLAVIYLKPSCSFPLWKDVLHLTYVENEGAAFGIFKDQRWIFIVLSIVAMIIIAAFVIYKRKRIPLMLSVALAFVFGGGIGNLIDRIVSGYVVDFIDFTLINFAVFNIADTFVCIGSGLIILYIILSDRKALNTSKKQGKIK